MSKLLERRSLPILSPLDINIASQVNKLPPPNVVIMHNKPINDLIHKHCDHRKREESNSCSKSQSPAP